VTVRIHKKLWSRTLTGKYHLEHLGTDGKMILKWILYKRDMTVWAGFIWIRTGSNTEPL